MWWSSKIKSRSAMKSRSRLPSTALGEGLDRPEAIHAIGLVLGEYIYDLARAREPETHRIESYYAALERLTADYWRRSG